VECEGTYPVVVAGLGRYECSEVEREMEEAYEVP